MFLLLSCLERPRRLSTEGRFSVDSSASDSLAVYAVDGVTYCNFLSSWIDHSLPATSVEVLAPVSAARSCQTLRLQLCSRIKTASNSSSSSSRDIVVVSSSRHAGDANDIAASISPGEMSPYSRRAAPEPLHACQKLVRSTPPLTVRGDSPPPPPAAQFGAN